MERFKLYNGNTDTDFMDIIEHGLKSFNCANDLSFIIDQILVSRGQPKRHSESPFYDFNYPNFETCKELIENDRDAYHGISFIVVLFDWYELYDKSRPLSDEAYTLALYLKRHKYINEKKEIVSENLFFEKLDMENIDLRNADDKKEDHGKKKVYEYNHYEDIDKIGMYDCKVEIPKYQIVNRFDSAYSYYKNGDRSNETFSKLFSVDPHEYDKHIGESQFFLVFARHDIPCGFVASEKYSKFKYNILYINILFPNSTQRYEEYIDIPEYNLYVAAVKMNNKPLIKKLLELYKEHGKFYKKMDLEKQSFIDEEIYEIPEVEPLDLITGDILNPYHESKNSKIIFLR